MAFGLGRLRLAPCEFWSLSLPELAAAMQPAVPATANAVTRNWLSQTMQQFPDRLAGENGLERGLSEPGDAPIQAHYQQKGAMP